MESKHVFTLFLGLLMSTATFNLSVVETKSDPVVNGGILSVGFWE